MSLLVWLAALLKAADIFSSFCMWLAPLRIEAPVREHYSFLLSFLTCFHLVRSVIFLFKQTRQYLVDSTEFPRLNLTYTSDTHCYIIFLRINRQAKTITASCFLSTENDVRSFHSKDGDHFTAANTQASDIDIPVVNEYVQLSCNTEDRKFKLRFFL